MDPFKGTLNLKPRVEKGLGFRTPYRSLMDPFKGTLNFKPRVEKGLRFRIRGLRFKVENPNLKTYALNSELEKHPSEPQALNPSHPE